MKPHVWTNCSAPAAGHSLASHAEHSGSGSVIVQDVTAVAASRALSVPSALSCRTMARSRVTFFINRCRSTRTLCLKDRHGELKIQRTNRRSMPKARRKKTRRAPPWPHICTALNHRHPLSGPSPRLSRSIRRASQMLLSACAVQADARRNVGTPLCDLHREHRRDRVVRAEMPRTPRG